MRASKRVGAVIGKARVSRGEGVGTEDVERVVQLPVHLAHAPCGVEEPLQHVLKDPRHAQSHGHALKQKMKDEGFIRGQAGATRSVINHQSVQPYSNMIASLYSCIIASLHSLLIAAREW